MSETLTIETTEYISPQDAGTRFGYSPTYMILLAKEEKIRGQKIGARWYLEPQSIDSFLKTHKELQTERRAQISQLRKSELELHSKKKIQTIKIPAVVFEAISILIIVLALGVTGYIGTSSVQTASVSETDTSFLERIAIKFYTYFNPQRTQNVRIVEAVPVTPSVEGVREILPTLTEKTPQTSLVIAPSAVMTTTTIESIRENFSDEVRVTMDPHDPQTGIIVPQFKNKEGNEYRFLMVPVVNGSDG